MRRLVQIASGGRDKVLYYRQRQAVRYRRRVAQRVRREPEVLEMMFAHFGASLRETFPARASEWALAFMVFNISIVFTLNEDFFASNPVALAGLERIMSQPSWAYLCYALGGGRLLVLMVNGAWRRSPHLRAAGAFLSTGFWFLILSGFWATGTFGFVMAIAPVLLLLDTYNTLRAIGEAGISDDLHARASRYEHHR